MSTKTRIQRVLFRNVSSAMECQCEGSSVVWEREQPAQGSQNQRLADVWRCLDCGLECDPVAVRWDESLSFLEAKIEPVLQDMENDDRLPSGSAYGPNALTKDIASALRRNHDISVFAIQQTALFLLGLADDPFAPLVKAASR